MSKTVLVADDNPAIRKALCEMFEVEEDYDICAEAVNGEEASRVLCIRGVLGRRT